MSLPTIGWAALLAASLLLPSCGVASRVRFAGMDISESRGSPEVLTDVRGHQPLLPGIWSYSVATATRDGSPEEALRLVERGLGFQPRDLDLMLMKVRLLSSVGRQAEAREAIAKGLASMPSAPAEAWLRAARIGDLLESDDLEGAEAEVLLLGGLRDVSLRMVAASWAQLALSHEVLGQREQADAAMDRSLDRGAGARSALLEATVIRPERQAADRGLRRRAAARHPGNVDMALSLIVDQMLAGEFATAETAISDLPAPVPSRLAHEIFAVHARVVLLQGRTEEGLELLREQLRRAPDNQYAIDVLLEAWLQRGEFTDEEVYGLLDRSRRVLRSGATRSKVEAALQELHMRLERSRRLESDPEIGPPSPVGS
jgi:tetratricopeptide (TPR) repeat protein